MRSKHYTARTNLVPRGRDPFGQQRGVSLLSCAGEKSGPLGTRLRANTPIETFWEAFLVCYSIFFTLYRSLEN